MRKICEICEICVPLFVLAAVVAGVVGAMRGCSWHVGQPPLTVKSDTVVIRDTVHDTVPRLVRSEVVRYVKETPIPVHDTVYMSMNDENVYMTDSGEVIVPISRKVYTDDSTYRAVVSGYKATLDEIDVYRRQLVITNTVTTSRRWNCGLTGGVGYGLLQRRPDLFVGVGVTFRLFPP